MISLPFHPSGSSDSSNPTPMTTSLTEDLQAHLALCEEILALTQRENQWLLDPGEPSPLELCQVRKRVLPRLNASLDTLRRRRDRWQQLSIAERARQPEVSALLRRNQDLIMKILVLDRENEQGLLRRGRVPARHLPAAGRQRPHIVADLYRRNGLGSAHAD